LVFFFFLNPASSNFIIVSDIQGMKMLFFLRKGCRYFESISFEFSVYTVQSAYNFLNANVTADLPVSVSSLWHKDVPLKVTLFAWRLFRNRLPTKDNLFRRQIIVMDAQACVGDCGEMETSHHLLLHCNFFGAVWYFIFRWLGIYAVMP